MMEELRTAETEPDAAPGIDAGLLDSSGPLWSGDGTTLDRSAAAARTRQLAAQLAGAGMRRGRKVGLHMPASGDRLCVTLALLSLGAVVVPLDPALGQARLTMAIQGAGLDLILQEGGRLPSSLRLTGVQTLALGDLDPAGQGAPSPAPHADQPGLLLYGDGDQDSGRGVILSHRALLSAARGLATRLDLGPGDRVALPLTVNHPARLTGALAAMMGGAELVADPTLASHLILADTRATRALIDRPIEADPKVIIAAGDGTQIRELTRRFPRARIYNSYARAELAGIALCSDPRDPPHTAHTTVGRPLRGVEVMIVDPRTGFDMLLYEIGEIWIRGAVVMDRYFHAPEATRRALDPAGFFHTGDMGYLDSEGRVIISRSAHAQI